MWLPTGNKIILKPIDAGPSSEILVTVVYYDKNPNRGEVAVVGPAVCDIYPGDIVVYGKYNFELISESGIDYHILRETDILAKIR